MPATRSPRKGSLQFWPRKRAKKFLPSVNWRFLKDGSSKNLKGFIAYKAGMASAYVKDNTPDSRTKDKKITVPVTILECPKMKILSVRFYKNKKVVKDVLNNKLDNVIVEYAGNENCPTEKPGNVIVGSGMSAYSSSIEITNSILRNSDSYGLRVIDNGEVTNSDWYDVNEFNNNAEGASNLNY